MGNDIIMETKNLRKDFGGLVAVSDVSIEVKAHSLHTIIGPNGGTVPAKPRFSICSAATWSRPRER